MKTLLTIGVIIAIFIGGYFLLTNQEETYVSTIDSEITALETELEAVDQQINNGSLTPEAAVSARAQITTRLNSLTAAVNSTQEGRINDEQRLALIDGLSRFNKALQDYQTTILIVEQTAAESADADDGISLVDSLSTAIATFSEISNNIQGYVEESIPDDFDSSAAVDESSLTPEELEAMASSSTTTATSTETEASATTEIAQ